MGGKAAGRRPFVSFTLSLAEVEELKSRGFILNITKKKT